MLCCLSGKEGSSAYIQGLSFQTLVISMVNARESWGITLGPSFDQCKLQHGFTRPTGNIIMPKTWIVRQRDVTLLLLWVLLSSDGLKMSNFFIGQILKAFLALFYFFRRKKFSSIEASRHYWKLKKQNKRHWNPVWDDQSIPCLAVDDGCRQPGTVGVGWGSLSLLCLPKGSSSAVTQQSGVGSPSPSPAPPEAALHPCPWTRHTTIQGVQQGTENTRTQNALERFIHGSAATRVSTASESLGGPCSLTPAQQLLLQGQAWAGWVAVTCTAAGQGGWPLQAGTKKEVKRGEISRIISCVIKLSPGRGTRGQFCLLWSAATPLTREE